MNSQPVNLATPLRKNREIESLARPGRLARIVAFLATVQLILLSVHWFVYHTWLAFHRYASGIPTLPTLLVLLSISFVGASLVAHRYNNIAVRLLYRLAATWLGMLNFFFLAACFCWIVYLGGRTLGSDFHRPAVATILFAVAALIGVCSILNARRIRVKRVAVKLPNLPRRWRGRIAAHVTDTHLGHVNGRAFLERIVVLLQQLQPDIVFITGDLYDGTKVDPDALAAPWRELSVPFGTYFVTGNHEEFSDPAKYLDALRRAQVRVLDNEKLTLEELQIVGVHYPDLIRPVRLRSILERAGLDRSKATVLLTHAPYGLAIAEEAGISLQLSGHTHGGQIFPFTRLTRRIFGDYTYGLKRFRDLVVYTSSGAGTWGPPMRFGTQPEISIIEFT